MAAAIDVAMTYQAGAVGTPLIAIRYTTIIGPVPPSGVAFGTLTIYLLT